MENSLSRQFHTAVMAYFPCTRISEENGTLKATWEIKQNCQYSVPVEKLRTLIDAGLFPSIYSPLPMLVPYEFELAFDTATARTTITSYVTGYSDWPPRQLDGMLELVDFLSHVQRSEVYHSVIDYTRFPQKILTRKLFDSRRRTKDAGETEGNNLG